MSDPDGGRSEAADLGGVGHMSAVSDSRAPADGRIGWLEQTVGGITDNIEHAIFTERHARSDGWLQRPVALAIARMLFPLRCMARISMNTSLEIIGYHLLSPRRRYHSLSPQVVHFSCPLLVHYSMPIDIVMATQIWVFTAFSEVA